MSLFESNVAETTEVSGPHGPIWGNWGKVDTDVILAEAKKFCEDQVAKYQAHLDTIDQWTVSQGEEYDDE